MVIRKKDTSLHENIHMHVYNGLKKINYCSNKMNNNYESYKFYINYNIL